MKAFIIIAVFIFLSNNVFFLSQYPDLRVKLLGIKNKALIILFIFLSPYIIGQRTETSLNFNHHKTHLNITSENDLLFQTDYYYTAGIALSYIAENLKSTPAQLILSSKKPNLISFNGFGIEQRIFTPFSIKSPYNLKGDRPYTAYIMLSNFSTVINLDKHLKLSNEIGFGVMGPAAKGEEVQTYVHGKIGSTLPNGWENQLSNSFLFDYFFRVEKGFFNNWATNHIIPIAELRAGTLIDKMAIGLMIKFGNVNKSLQKKSELNLSKKILVWEWLFEGKYQRIVYDATLQGGLFSGEKISSLSRQEVLFRQYHLRSGFNLYYKRLFFRYMIHFNSRNFSSGRIHQYGSINIGVSF